MRWRLPPPIRLWINGVFFAPKPYFTKRNPCFCGGSFFHAKKASGDGGFSCFPQTINKFPTELSTILDLICRGIIREIRTSERSRDEEKRDPHLPLLPLCPGQRRCGKRKRRIFSTVRNRAAGGKRRNPERVERKENRRIGSLRLRVEEAQTSGKKRSGKCQSRARCSNRKAGGAGKAGGTGGTGESRGNRGEPGEPGEARRHCWLGLRPPSHARRKRNRFLRRAVFRRRHPICVHSPTRDAFLSRNGDFRAVPLPGGTLTGNGGALPTTLCPASGARRRTSLRARPPPWRRCRAIQVCAVGIPSGAALVMPPA